MIDFLILYELKQRDIESIILIGNELKKRGYTVEYLYIYIYKLKDKMFTSRKNFNNVKVILASGIRNNYDFVNIMYYYAGKVNKIVNLQWEQIFTIEAEKDVNNSVYPRELAKNVIHLCWGRKPFENLINVGVSKENLFICGPAHMDFLRPMFKNYYMDKEELFTKYRINKSNRTILFISSFVLSSLTKRQFENLERLTNEDYNEDYIIAVKSFEELMRWFEQLLSLRKDINLVYRPHPAEFDSKKLAQMKSKYKNFHVISEHSVKQWIFTCDLITTWISTSIVDAFFANKPCLILRPINMPLSKENVLYKDADTITNFEEFVKIIDCGDIEMPIAKDVIAKYYDFNQIKPSYIRISDELELLIRNEKLDYPWDRKLISSCNIEIYKRILFDCILFVYTIVLEVMSIVQEKTGIHFHQQIKGRVDSYRNSKSKWRKNYVSKEEFEQLSERLVRITKKG